MKNIKRLVDIFLSISILFFSVPLIIIILVVVYFETKQIPVIVQTRYLTFEKDKIKLIKIRTIKENKLFKKVENESGNIFQKQEYKSFVPPFCRWLRKSGLDEILQLLNVIMGEMSIVGPHPLIKNDLIILKQNHPELYTRRIKLESKPGITGCWQIWGDRNKCAENLVTLDETYEKNKSIKYDLKIICKTFYIVLYAKHSDSIIMDDKKYLNQYFRTASKCLRY